jgi:diketogulonate reductase-like aldo/keto reductase
LISAAAAGTILPIGTSRVDAGEKSLITRAIPSSGEKIPIIGLGSWNVFDVRPGSPETKQLGDVLSLFVKHGGKVIDSSPMYGNAETVIGDLAAKLNLTKSLFIATKVWTKGRQQGITQMEHSLDLFHTKTIDLMQVHNLSDIDTQMATLREWKSKSKIRYTGITHSEAVGFAEVERNMKQWKPDFVQINYSLVERGAAQRILPLAQQLRMGVVVNRPFGGGGVLKALASKPLPEWAADFDCHSWAQILLKWIIAHPAVTCVIPATNNPQHVVDNLAAGSGRLPDAKMRDAMAALFVGF